MEHFWETAKQLIKFSIIGISNTLISLGIYYGLYFLGVNYLIANAAGFVVSVLNAYYWNNKYVFKKTSSGNKRALARTFLAYGSTFLLSTFLMFIMVDCMGLSGVIAPLISLVITTPLNFLMNKFWAFK
ncbi:MAG: hypothetical protein RUMPE_01153 [Eubacteriales bacterium SKADARSKE-1]|nr:hypothetical protein [Eubacteriales bacterium SKADARSKE-1]